MDIKHLFFDLDRTLWDFESNSHNELINLYNQFKLHQLGISLPLEFIKVYKKINEECWQKYRQNALTKEKLRSERFKLALAYFGVENEKLAQDIGSAYVVNSPYRTSLIDGAVDLLDYLYGKYTLHVITNGFEEVQHIKMAQSNLTKYFDQIITSESAGAKKPSSLVFEYAIKKSGANLDDSIMIGDDLNTDIVGAIDFGMKSIYFNPNRKIHDYSIWNEVSSLLEIKSIL
jgi:putative hydrolase of the HAD superfamily